MADLFTKTEVDFGGAMHAQDGIIQAVGGVQIGVLLQNIQLQYSQQVTRIYELGTAGRRTNVYLICGRSQGQMTAAHVIGPGVALKAYYDKFSDVCQARDNSIDLNLGPNVCGTAQRGLIGAIGGILGAIFGGGAATGLKYTCKYCVLTSIGMSVQAQDFVINENSQIMFSGLEYKGV